MTVAMHAPRPNLEPPEPIAPEPCACGVNAGTCTPCPECRVPLCEECEIDTCGECLEAVCPRHLKNVMLKGIKVPVCGLCLDRLLEECEACDCDGEDCDWCREQGRRYRRRLAEREAKEEGRLADLMMEVIGDV